MYDVFHGHLRNSLKSYSAPSHNIYLIDFIHDTRHLCTRLRTDGIKAMSRAFSGGQQLKKSADTRNRGQVCLFYTTENEERFILKTIMRNCGWK